MFTTFRCRCKKYNIVYYYMLNKWRVLQSIHYECKILHIYCQTKRQFNYTYDILITQFNTYIKKLYLNKQKQTKERKKTMYYSDSDLYCYVLNTPFT